MNRHRPLGAFLGPRHNGGMTKLRCAIALFATAAASASCKKEEAKPAEPGAAKVEAGKEGASASAEAGKAAAAQVAAQVGVDPGPVEHKEGATAVLAAVQGTVEVRRLGEETFAPAKANAALYGGDQIRTGDGARATVAFPDESVAEVAEASTLSIGSRVATADPASSAAILAGVARFSVSPRAPAEGPFLVFAPAGVIATKGTAFGVGVAADGDARVGVETGSVEVSGLAAFDAPVTVEAGSAVDLAAAGSVAAPAPWPADDWGAWRAQADANLDVAATVDAHSTAMAQLATELDAAYADLQALGTTVASFEASASAKAGDTAKYEASLPEGAAAIDASFLAALRLELLTHAYEAHAALATDLYVRSPDVVVWAPVAPRVSAAVLWPKRFDVTAAVYLEPLRVQYYVHHPVGRVHAELVGIAVPAFYAKVTPPPVPDVRAKLKFKVFAPPVVVATAVARPVYIAAPSVDWRAHVKVKVAPPRAKVAFYVRPPDFKASAIVGAQVKAQVAPLFAIRPPQVRGEIQGAWKVAIGQQIHVEPPDLAAAAKARAQFKVGVGVPDVRAGVGARVGAGAQMPAVAVPDVKGGVKAGIKARVDVPDVKAKVKVQVPDVKARIKAGADVVGGAAAKAKAGIKAGAAVKVKAPEVKVKAPSVKVKAGASVKAGGKLKLGN